MIAMGKIETPPSNARRIPRRLRPVLRAVTRRLVWLVFLMEALAEVARFAKVAGLG
jgi:hypothetical protein